MAQKIIWLVFCIWSLIFVVSASIQYDSTTCTSDGRMQIHLIPKNTLIHFKSKNFPYPDKYGLDERENIFGCNETFVSVYIFNLIFHLI